MLKSRNKTKNDEIFSVGHLDNNLRNHSISSAKITLTAQLIKLGLHLSIIMILARLLTPEDYGLFAMVAIFSSLGMSLLDGSLSMASIQKEDICHREVSNLFWLNVFVGSILTLIAIISSPIISSIYGEPKLVEIIIAVSAAFLLTGLSVQHDAILKRKMRFLEVAAIDIMSIVVGGLIGIYLAYMGFSYWALVLNYLITAATKTLLTWLTVKWIPSWFSVTTETKKLIKFGVHLAGGSFLGFLSKNITPFSIGYIGNPFYLGLYNRTFALASIPSAQAFPPILSVLRPALFRVSKDKEKLKKVAISLLTKVAMFTTFLSLIIYSGSEYIVLIMLGEKWAEAESVLKILAIVTFGTPIASMTASIMIAVGATKELFRWQFFVLTVLLICIGIGSLFGVYGILYSVLVSVIFIRLPIFFMYASRYQPVTTAEFYKAIIFPAAIGIFSYIPVMALVSVFKIDNFLGIFSVYFVLPGTMYLLLCVCIKTTRSHMIEMYETVYNSYKKRVK